MDTQVSERKGLLKGHMDEKVKKRERTFFWRKGLIVLLVLFAATGTYLHASSAVKASSESINRYNVVFVTDASGSLKRTDPEGNRFDAIDLFLGLSANGGNYIGSVAFGEGVALERGIKELKNQRDKKMITEELRTLPLENWTDIGSGLESAVAMIDREGNPELASIVILLTDGNTDMSTPEALEESIEKKETAVEKAREKNIAVYTIVLNQNNAANSQEMRQIAAATGGQFQEVTSAEDLQSVFDLYYQMIYSTESIELVNEKTSENGEISRDFKVADIGVEEVNVVIFGEAIDCRLTKPDQTMLSQKELTESLYHGDSFTLVKLTDPSAGEWHMDVKAPAGSSVRIFKIYNPNLEISATVENGKDSYMKNEEIPVVVQLMENGSVITDSTRYGEYSVIFEVTDYNGNVVASETVRAASPDGFRYMFIPQDYGTYYMRARAESEELSAEAEKIVFHVGNTPPSIVQEVIEKHINRWPFLFKTNATISLVGAAQDAEDEALGYRVASSSWLEEDYTLEGDQLTIDRFTPSKGSFEIEAYDSLGAYCTFIVRVTSTNIGLWAVVLILIAGAIAALILGILTYKSFLIPFMGEITVENIATRQKETRQQSRGHIKLSTFAVGQSGIEGYFQATGKSFIYFKSKKPIYDEFNGKKVKKVKIDEGEIKMSPNTEFKQGINVRFDSFR